MVHPYLFQPLAAPGISWLVVMEDSLCPSLHGHLSFLSLSSPFLIGTPITSVQRSTLLQYNVISANCIWNDSASKIRSFWGTGDINISFWGYATQPIIMSFCEIQIILYFFPPVINYKTKSCNSRCTVLVSNALYWGKRLYSVIIL